MNHNERTATDEYVTQVRQSLNHVKDPRVQGRVTHSLLNIVVISLLAVLSGAEDWEDLEMYGEERREWLREFLDLPNEESIPGHDTFRRVLSALDQKAFATALFELTRALHQAVGGSSIAIDGKMLRGTCDATGQGGLHLVSAWATDLQATLGLVACGAKSNEITAIPELLKLLDLRKSTVTIDAMGCQTAIAEQIRAGGGQYVLAVKGNQHYLKKQMEALYEEAAAHHFDGVVHARLDQQEQAHGRDEERICIAMQIPMDHPQCAKWRDLRTLVVIANCRYEDKGTERWQTRLYISSLAPDAVLLARAIRAHWSIENQQHWSLDVTFHEDGQRARDKNALANLAAIKRLALSLLRQEKTNTRSLRKKRFTCALDNGYVLKVLKSAQV